MSASERSFGENLDLLIKLLRKLKDTSRFEGMPGMPRMFVTNFDFFLHNYEKMKDQISEQLLQQFGEPIKQMVADMVEQLKEELNDGVIPETEETEQPPVITGQKKTVGDIDEMLRNPDLTDEEIDKLLDERNRLMQK